MAHLASYRVAGHDGPGSQARASPSSDCLLPDAPSAPLASPATTLPHGDLSTNHAVPALARAGPLAPLPPRPGTMDMQVVEADDDVPGSDSPDQRSDALGPADSTESCRWPLEARKLTGPAADIRVPNWTLPTTSRSWRLKFSILSQVDGLASKCRGRGARIERDVLATDQDHAVCPVFNHAAWMALGSFSGLYLCDFEHIPEVVATVVTHRGYGFFVVPVMPATRPALIVLRKSSKTGIWRRYGWYDYLLSFAEMVFDLPPDAFVTLDGSPFRHTTKVQIVFAQFGRNGRFKSQPRPEKRFRLFCIPELDRAGPMLGVRPTLLHRVSPLSWDAGPTAADDTCPATDVPDRTGRSSPPASLPSRWTSVMGAMSALADSYPCKGVASLALEVLTTGLNPFKGALDKPVIHPTRLPCDDTSSMAQRSAMMKEVELPSPRIAGPFRECPFPTPRVCPTDTVRKDRYDPQSERLRLISNFSKRGRGATGGSVNDLSWSPKLLSFHAQPSHLRDTIAFLYITFGAGILAWTADIPGCFRLNHIHAALLSLFVYCVVTAQFGTEWFVDLATPFGWSPAEWGWQCVLALILWAFRIRDLGEMFAFVDNFFYIMHPSQLPAGDSVTSVFARIASIFASLNVPLHEEMIGERFKGLGWMWHLAPDAGPPLMVCADDKHAFLCRKLTEWRAASELPIHEVESIIGFMAWISTGFPIGLPHVAYLRVNLNHHKFQCVRQQPGIALRNQVVQLTKQAREAISFWHRFFPTWNMRCPVFLDFGPVAGPEVLWRFDACTDWGMGAFSWHIGEPVACYVAHAWTADERKVAFVQKRESTGVFEGMAAVLCASNFSSRCRDKRVLMEGDNEALSSGIRRCYSPTRSMMKQIHKVWSRTSRAGICLRSAHITGSCSLFLVRGSFNSRLSRKRSLLSCRCTCSHFYVVRAGSVLNIIADHLSHGRFRLAKLCASEELGVDLQRLPLHGAH